MGLDMFIYRATKPVVNQTMIYEPRDFSLSIPEKEAEEDMYDDISPYLSVVQVRAEYYDMDKIRSDFGLSAKAHISRVSAEGIGVSDSAQDKRVSISQEDIDAKYTKVEIETHYVCNLERIHYWRKAYDVQDWFHDNLSADYIENCGYYLVDEELVNAYNEAFPDDPILFTGRQDENSALFYHEWY